MDAARNPALHGEPTPGSAPAVDALWYKDAVIYQVNVKAFFDSNDDGVGDFNGLSSKLDYIRDLGVNTLWVMPFYPSPLRDDGYDIAEYENVHSHYGTLDDFRRFLDEAHRRNLKVITELVINHTSDSHPWFQRARLAPPGSPERNFYVWSDTDDKYRGTRIIFTDTETSNWTWDPVAKAYFWHRFFSHQPDLNFDNPLVLEAVFHTMRFWFDMGVDGFRLDAIPYLCEREGTNNENLPETHAVIKQLRAAVDANYTNRFLLAEANQWPEDVRDYFGDGDECHAAYHFPLMPRIYMAIAQENRFPVVEIMAQTPDIPDTCQWCIFLRNHDELTLEMVTSKERDYMYDTYAADPQARINLGIRRRLAPLMDNDTDRIKLMNSLLLSMPGSPIIYYGDEIGMGDNVFIGDRNGVRTPMQWSPDRNAGFSRADPQRLYLPPIMDAVYGYQAVNVESQMRDPSSLLNWMRRLLGVRHTSRAFGRGRLTFLKAGNRKVLAYLREYEPGPGEAGESDVVLVVANLSRTAQPVELDLSRYKGRVPVELLGRTPFPPIGELPYLLTLAAYGFYWFRLDTEAAMPDWHAKVLPTEDLPVLVLFDGWLSLFREQVVPWRIGLAVKTRNQFESELMPRFLEAQRWYASKGRAIARARLDGHAIWSQGPDAWLLGLYQIEGIDAPADEATYFVPLAMGWEDSDEERSRKLAAAAVARVRQQANVGVMGDAFADERFCRAMLAAIRSGTELPGQGGRLRFRATAAFARIAGEDPLALPVSRAQDQSSNTVVTFDETLFLKGYRRIRSGVNPEFEIGHFLTEVARFEHCVPMAGSVEFVPDGGGEPLTLAMVQGYVSNQGDGWSYALAYLQRYLQLRRSSTEPARPDDHGAWLDLVHTLGRRTAELHLAFARHHGLPAFDPEPLTAADLARLRTAIADDVRTTLDLLDARRPQLPPAAAPEARRLLDARAALLALVERAAALPIAQHKARYHGDYHLGQVLVTKNDFVIIDFEGEPGRTLAERRTKQSPLKDVAGMLRSFGYCASAALREAGVPPEDEAMLATLLAQWEAGSRAAFLRGYAQTARDGGLQIADDGSVPVSPVSAPPEQAGLAAAVVHVRDQLGLLGLFELEKALYELRYELDNRPDWVRIPLNGILGLLASRSEPAAAAT